MRQKIDLVFPVLPPVLDGIGDHTACLARALADNADVRIWTSSGDFNPISGVEIAEAFTVSKPWGVNRLLDRIETDPPDWLVFQFNQFSYGRWGLNPNLPLLLGKMKRRIPRMRIVWIAHEDFVPVSSLKFAVMTTWQRWQFWMLGRRSDLVFFSIDPWVRKYQPWFRDVRVEHLPIGSTMPRLDVARRQARERIGISEETFVAGVFGTVNPSRLLAHIKRASLALQGRAKEFVLLYVGPHGQAMKAAMDPLPVMATGALSAKDVSVHLSAMDIHLTPFIDGVSTRRTSFMAGLQHAIPTVGTAGPLTDDVLRSAAGESFLLTPVENADAFAASAISLFDSPEWRTAMGSAGRSLYDASFSFDATAQKFLRVIADC